MATVFCKRCDKDGPEIEARLTFSGDFADSIRANICADCWREWMDMQIKVINEYRLHMGEASHRETLASVAAQFFRLDGGSGELGPGPEGGLA
ncbi:MAG: Fe(2+)-trafficking protein [Myxococcota bacterium]